MYVYTNKTVSWRLGKSSNADKISHVFTYIYMYIHMTHVTVSCHQGRRESVVMLTR